MPFRWRVVVGFALAPLVSFVAFTVWIVLSSLVHLGPIDKQPLSSLLETSLRSSGTRFLASRVSPRRS